VETVVYHAAAVPQGSRAIGAHGHGAHGRIDRRLPIARLGAITGNNREEAPMAELKKVTASMMNAIHDLPLLVARDEGYFRDEGLDVTVLTTPGSGQATSDDRALKDDIFARTMEALYDQGQCDQFRMCEWGIMKRAVETNVEQGHRTAKIVALGSAMSSFAIVTDPKTGIYEPEQLKNVPIAVSRFNGSHFTMLKMMEGFIKRDEIAIANAGTHKQRLDALKEGRVKAASLQEPWISVAEKLGCRVLIESRSTRSEAAGEELDGPTLAKMFRAEAHAAEAIDRNPAKYAHYLVEEAGGAIDLSELRLWRILNAPPTPYSRQRFDDNYQWTLGWGLVPPGATYENTVDNRAWQ
jgi:NitT/TauT family transport system substrate-binding protein